MAAFDPATLDRWRALAIVDRDGTTVGTIKEFYLDRETGFPTWALVNTGLFGATQTFVPLVHATEISDGLQVPYEKSHIKDTPKVDLHDELSPEEEAELFTHYGVGYQPSADAGSDADLATGATPTTPGTPASADLDPGSDTPAEGPGPVPADAGPESPPGVDDGGALGAVPPEPGSVDAAETVDAGPAPAPVGTTEADTAGPRQDDAEAGNDTPGFGTANDTVLVDPHTPGSEAKDDATRAEPDATRSEATNDAAPAEPDTIRSHATNDAASAEPKTITSEAANDAVPAEPGTTEPDGTTPPDLDPDRSRPEPHDPDLARTAPVEPGLPGSTAPSPYGPAPTTIDKDVADPSGASTEEPLRVPGEAGWAPGGAAGSFEEHEPFDRPTGASDRWREAKLAAERDRVARAGAAQPEDRSPLERARRRLERLVGGGQDHPDEVSPADREAAERDRRARLGLEEDDSRSP